MPPESIPVRPPSRAFQGIIRAVPTRFCRARERLPSVRSRASGSIGCVRSSLHSRERHCPTWKLYRVTWLVAILLALTAFFALRPTHVPPLADQPASFDGGNALQYVGTLTQAYTNRVAGSDADARTALWISERLKDLGLEPHFDSFVASIEGKNTPLQNVWAVSKGTGGGTSDVILIVAQRDSPPQSVQGADDNASGIGALLELARVFSLQTHARPFVFLWSDGDAYGSLGSRDFAARHSDMNIRAAIALEQVGLAKADSIVLDGWSAGSRVAPPWIWALANSAGKAEAKLVTPLPNFVTQSIRLAAPIGGGSQAPLVAAGIPALTLSAGGTEPPPELDTLTTVSSQTLRRIGRAAERMVTSIDAVVTPLPRSSSSIFFSRSRAMPGVAIELALLVLLVPPGMVALDLLAAARRRRVRLGPAWMLYILRFAPWFAMLLLVYVANLLSLLPSNPGAAIPPDALMAHSPRYVRAFLLLALLIAAALYAHAIERRLVRRVAVPAENTVTVVHVVLLAVAVLALLVNPFSLIIVLPAAVLWPLARSGPWPVSRLPAWGGLAALAAVLIYVGVHVHLGWSVWWYFFLLIENRTLPVGMAVLGVAFVTAAIHLGHHLHRPPRRRTARLRPAAPEPQNENRAATTGDLGQSSPRDGDSPGLTQ